MTRTHFFNHRAATISRPPVTPNIVSKTLFQSCPGCPGCTPTHVNAEILVGSHSHCGGEIAVGMKKIRPNDLVMKKRCYRAG